MLTDAIGERDMFNLFWRFVKEVRAAGIPMDRANLHIGTLHPQLFGYAWAWSVEDNIIDEVTVGEAALSSASYQANPLSRVLEQGEEFHIKMTEENKQDLSPLLLELWERDFTEYVAFPINRIGDQHNAVTVSTKATTGFTTGQRLALKRLMQLLGLHLERHIAHAIGTNVSDAYLGREASAQVMAGTIKRGTGRPLDAIIWVSDMRGFTQLSEELAGPQLTATLNAYFEIIAGTVLDYGGEVLKFLGDGVLGVFAFERFDQEADAAEAAIRAANQALTELSSLNRKRVLESSEGLNERTLKTGIALHKGTVFFGNVGAKQRLDFTVIGPSVNAATRLEARCKPTGHDILLSESVATLIDRPVAELVDETIVDGRRCEKVFTIECEHVR